MMQPPSTNKTVTGRWKITWMEMWDQDFVDLVVPGYIEIYSDGVGEFEFGAVTGGFGTATPDGRYFHSQWEGSDEMDEDRGEIYGTLDDENANDGELFGTLSFWNGDESDYRAVRMESLSK